jgi:hypothetical protein
MVLYLNVLLPLLTTLISMLDEEIVLSEIVIMQSRYLSKFWIMTGEHPNFVLLIC